MGWASEILAGAAGAAGAVDTTRRGEEAAKLREMIAVLQQQGLSDRAQLAEGGRMTRAEMSDALGRDKAKQSADQHSADVTQRATEFQTKHEDWSKGLEQQRELGIMRDKTQNVLGSARIAATTRGQDMTQSTALSGQQVSADNAAKRAAIPVAPKSEPLVPVMGSDGRPVLMPRSEAAGKRPASTRENITGQERQTLAFYNRAKNAMDTLATTDDTGTALEDRLANAGTMQQERLAHSPNWLQSADGQAYQQAQRSFTEARLRKESGAAISKSEYEKDAQTYFVQPGDGPKQIEQKRKARQVVLDGLKFGSGRAYDEFYGERNAQPAGDDDPLGILK